jgi:hypothetical protein
MGFTLNGNFILTGISVTYSAKFNGLELGFLFTIKNKIGGSMKLKALLFFSLIFVSFCFVETIAQTFQTGKIAITMNEFGRVRVIKDSIAGVRQIDRSSFLAGINRESVFSYRRSAEAEDSMKNVVNPAISHYEIAGSVNSSYDESGFSPDLLVKHNVYGWDGDAFVLVKFTVINRESSEKNTILGMEMISQLDGSYGLETIEYLDGSGVIAQYRLPTSTHVGYKIISQPMTTLKTFEWYNRYDTSVVDLYTWLNYRQIDTLYDSGGDGAVVVFSQDPVLIAAGDSAVMWVGISIGANKAEIETNMNLAENRYNTVTSVKELNSAIPSAYELEQNYPNPFNPSTTIRFNIPQKDYVSLKVYDILGNEVADLLSNTFEAGSHSINFNAGKLASGIYFYQLITSGYSETKKMNLLK